MTALTDKAVKDLKNFVEVLKSKPDILHDPKIVFFKDYLQSLGATIPPKKEPEPVVEDVEPPQKTKQPEHHHEKPADKPADKSADKPAEKPAEKEPEPPKEEEKDEPDPELWAADNDTPAFIGESSQEVSEEDEDAAFSLMAEARKAMASKDFKVAEEKLTEAIKKNPKSAVLYAARGEAFLAQQKPNAALRDGNKAYEFNPNSARANKVRGKAFRHLGQYDEAYKALSQGNTTDWDQDTENMIKAIKARAEKEAQRKRNADKKKQEDEFEARKKQAQEARKRQMEEEEQRRQEEEEMGGEGGQMPSFFTEIFNDPEVKAALSNPETMKKIQECMQDPTKAAIYAQTDPSFKRILEKLGPLAGAFKGAGGGAPFGGAPSGAGPSGAGSSGAAKPVVPDDDLD